jgi:nucleotide-binding universal stress UspA family protein/galactitol-specific phosphotransferase system IIB component
MTFTALLVPVEADTDPDYRLAFAANLANQFDAKLIGVCAEMWQSPVGDLGDGLGTSFLVRNVFSEVEADLARAEAKFKGIATVVHNGLEWRAAMQLPVSQIAAQARAADLIVTSRNVYQGMSDHKIAGPGALVLQSGRPVIVAPAETTKLELRSVVVAWKDTRESRRAIVDALPFLQHAEGVLVAEVCDYQDEAIAKERLTDVTDSLLRHGVRASIEVSIAEKGVPAPQQFLDLADQHKADLIVAGGYGHNRLQEWVFGGFTHALLTQTSRAVLLSH